MSLSADIQILKMMVGAIHQNVNAIRDHQAQVAEQMAKTATPAASDPERKLDCLENIFFLLHEGDRKIDAIRFCRELTGCALKDAKDKIEFLQSRYFKPGEPKR